MGEDRAKGGGCKEVKTATALQARNHKKTCGKGTDWRREQLEPEVKPESKKSDSRGEEHPAGSQGRD